jgi:hypothetical protein
VQIPAEAATAPIGAFGEGRVSRGDG